MNFKKVYKQIKDKFKKHSVDENCTNFCADVLKIGRSAVQFKSEISFIEMLKLKLAARKRIKGKPLNKILKQSNFYGRNFVVSKSVLAPRIQTEFVVSEALKYVNEKSKVLDMCTGSGVIGITINMEKKASVTATDISEKALKIARKNAETIGANVGFIKSNMFENLDRKTRYDVFVSNPPYIKSEEIKSLDNEVKDYDPILALDGGQDGLDFYRIIADNVSRYLAPSGVVVLEIGHDQKKAVSALFKNFKVNVIKDYDGNDRVLIAKLR